MKLKSFRIRNFRSIKDISLSMPDSGLMVLVGENASGKSNILRALYNLLGKNWWGKNIVLTDYFRNNPENKIYISLQFDNGYSVVFDDKGHWARYLDADNKEIYPSKGLIKDDFPAVMLDPERDFRQFFSFHRWSTFGKISSIMNKKLSEQPVVSQVIEKINEINDLLKEYSDLGGFDAKLRELLRNIVLYDSEVSFSVLSPVNLLSQLTVISKLDYGETDFDRMSSSEKNLIAISVLISYIQIFLNSRSGLIILENPELYLTPKYQLHLYEFLQEYALSSNYQFIISTASPYLVDLRNLDQVVRVFKNRGITQVKQLRYSDLSKLFSGAYSLETIRSSINLSYSFDLGEALMTSEIILVQNDLLLKTIRTLLEFYDKDLAEKVVVVSAKGKRPMVLYAQIFFSMGLKVICIGENSTNIDFRDNEIFSQVWKLSVIDIEEFDKDYKVWKLSEELALFIINGDVNQLLMSEFYRVVREFQLSVSIKDIKKDFSNMLADETDFWLYAMLSILDKNTDFLYNFYLDIRERLF